MSTQKILPGLFGQKHSNRDYTKEKHGERINSIVPSQHLLLHICHQKIFYRYIYV